MSGDPDSIRREFDTAAEQVKAHAAGNTGVVLSQLHDAVLGMRDAGFDASLEFFVPGRVNAPPQSKAYAAGLVTLGGMEIDFTIAPHVTYSEYTLIQLSVSGAPVSEIWLTGADQQDRIRAGLFELKARADHAAIYNVSSEPVKQMRKPKLNT